MKTEITVKVEFSAAHRLMHHKGKCRNVHGHNYKAVVTLTGDVDKGGDTGMFIDFGDARKEIKSWIDEKWDHALLLNSSDPLLELGSCNRPAYPSGISSFAKVYSFEQDPTAEELASTLFLEISERFPEGVDVSRVEIHENSRSTATVTGGCNGC